MGTRSTAVSTLAATIIALAMSTSPVLAETEVSDPLEPVNRGIFVFNDTLDRYLLEPVARGYRFVMPDRGEKAVSNFFSNLRTPVDLVNTILQGKPKEAGTVLGRFVVNTTVGVGGLFDAAGSAGYRAAHEDFGQTLGVWGVGNGPYLMLPFFGPSTLRDGTGTFADGFVRIWPWYVPWEVAAGAGALNGVNTRASFIEEVEAARETSLDYYSFVRNAYLQRRAHLVADEPADPENEHDDLYYFDDE